MMQGQKHLAYQDQWTGELQVTHKKIIQSKFECAKHIKMLIVTLSGIHSLLIIQPLSTGHALSSFTHKKIIQSKFECAKHIRMLIVTLSGIYSFRVFGDIDTMSELYSCSQCNQSSSHKSSLARHMITHTRDKKR